MSWISWLSYGICFSIVLSCFRPGADILSPARVFGFTWSLSIGLAELKLSGFQHTWTFLSWVLLLTAVTAFLAGTLVAYVLNIRNTVLPLTRIRDGFADEQVRESRLFWLICLATAVYGTAYVLNYMAKGWLPIEAAERQVSRVDFNVTGLSFLTYLVPSITFLSVIYLLKVRGKRWKKTALSFILVVVLLSFLLFVSRFQIVIILVVCGTYFYYATHRLRPRTALILLLVAVGVFYGISSIRLSHVVTQYLYFTSRMHVPAEYWFLTEPYMYCVMNLENFARSVDRLDYHTFGYYTFDFLTAMTGLKYWVYDYFNMNRLPFLVSGYNTYTAFWNFYFDFGPVGLAAIPLLLGFGTGSLYYRMRTKPSTRNVTAYGVAVFVMLFSFFVFPISFLWFELNLLVLYVVLRWTIPPHTSLTAATV